jgi:group I intron endonuclease
MIGIYRITHKATGRHYVGQSVNILERWSEHPRRDSHVGRALRKYGKDAFEFAVLCECTEAELHGLEARWIKELECTTKGFNKSTGGVQPRLVQASRHKISVAQKARWAAEPERLAAATRAALQRPEVRAKIAGSVSRAFKALPEAKQQVLRDKLAARIRQPEVLAKIGAATRARWQDPAIRDKMKKTGPLPSRRRPDIFVFEHADGRRIEATLWEMANVHRHLSTQKAHNLISGYRKTSQGWKLTGVVAEQHNPPHAQAPTLLLQQENS